MFSAEKRVKLSNRSISNVNAKEILSANSVDHGIGNDDSPLDFTDTDFSLPDMKRKGVIARKMSFSTNKQSFEQSDLHHTSSGYSSLLSSTSSCSNRSSHNRTPTKRKINSDENVSPVKIRKIESSDRNRAKRILKEKCSSENVLQTSTPIRGNGRSLLWGKSHSFHPQRSDAKKGLGEVGSFEKPTALPTPCEISFDVSELEFTTSFDQMTSAVNQDSIIPPNFQQLLTNSMVAQANPKESQETHNSLTQSTLSTTSQRRSYHGRVKFDLLGKLNRSKDLALNLIFSHLSDADLLSLSQVSKDYRNMIKTNKTIETRRLQYLTVHQQKKENKIPGGSFINVTKSKLKDRKRAFGETNVNHSMQLRSTMSSPRTSPSRKRLPENQNIVQTNAGFKIKCPSCLKMTAKISSIAIRRSPRKKKKRNVSSIMKISSGRIQKRSRSFLDKPSIDSQCSSNHHYVTFPELEEYNSEVSTRSSVGSSPSSEDSSGNELANDTEMYEFAECSGKACRFKFCTNCKERYHPRQKCKELAPASPSRGFSYDSSGSCVLRSLTNSKRSLKRLIEI